MIGDIKRQPKSREGMLLEGEGSSAEGALTFVAKEENTLEAILAKLRLFKMAKNTVIVARLGKRSDGLSAKLPYELACMKQAHVASLLLLGHSARLWDLRNFVLNWEAGQGRAGQGRAGQGRAGQGRAGQAWVSR